MPRLNRLAAAQVMAMVAAVKLATILWVQDLPYVSADPLAWLVLA